MRIFYDKNTGNEIIDVTGTMTEAQARNKFGITVSDSKDISDGEYCVPVGGKLEKRSISDVVNSRLEEKRDLRDKAAQRIKQKLGLTDNEFEDLRQALMP